MFRGCVHVFFRSGGFAIRPHWQYKSRRWHGILKASAMPMDYKSINYFAV